MRGPLALALMVIAITGCAADPAKDPSYMLVELVAVEDGDGVAPKSARVEVLDGKTSLTTLCVRLAKPSAETPASFVLKRDFGKDPRKRVTVRVTGYEGLGGDSSADVGKEFACPPGMLPPPIAPPQVLAIDFCEAEARKIVFNVGAICGCATPDGGPPPHDAGSDAGDPDAGSMDDAGIDDGGIEAGSPEAGAPDASAPDASAPDASAPDAGTHDAGMPDAGMPDGGSCACDSESVCGAGLSTSGSACPPGECCARELSSSCALEPAH